MSSTHNRSLLSSRKTLCPIRTIASTLSVILAVVFVNNSAMAQDLKTSSPRSIYTKHRESIKNRNWSQFTETTSTELLKFYVHNIIIEMCYIKTNFEKLTQICKEEGIDFEEHMNSTKEGTVDSLIEKIVSNEALTRKIFGVYVKIFGSRALGFYKGELRNRKVEESRATGLVSVGDRVIVNGVETLKFDDDEIFFRLRNDGWRICLETEWNDSGWKYRSASPKQTKEKGVLNPKPTGVKGTNEEVGDYVGVRLGFRFWI